MGNSGADPGLPVAFLGPVRGELWRSVLFTIPGPTPPWVHLNFSLGTVKKRVTLSGAPSIVKRTDLHNSQYLTRKMLVSGV